MMYTDYRGSLSPWNINHINQNYEFFPIQGFVRDSTLKNMHISKGISNMEAYFYNFQKRPDSFKE